MNNENIEIITPKELIKNITKTNTKDDYQQYDNFFTNIDFDKHRKLYKKLGTSNFYDKLKDLFNSRFFLFGKDKYEFQKEILNELSNTNLGNSYMDEKFNQLNKSLTAIGGNKEKKVDTLWNIIFKKIGNYLDKLLSPILLPFFIYIENKENLLDGKNIYLYEDDVKYLVKYMYFLSYIPFFGKKIIKNLYEKNKKNIIQNLSDIVENKLYTGLLEISLKKDLNIIDSIKKDLNIIDVFYFDRKNKEGSFFEFILDDPKRKEKLRLINIIVTIYKKEKLKFFIESNFSIFNELYNKETQLVQEILIKLNKRFVNSLILILGKKELDYYVKFFENYVKGINNIKDIKFYESFFYVISLILDKRFIYSKFSPKYFFYGKKEGYHDILNKKNLISNFSGFNQFKYDYIFHYILESGDLYKKESILRVLKKMIYIDYNYVKTNNYGDKNEQLIEKTYKDRIYQLLKSDSTNEFELAVNFLIETLKIDTEFIDIYEIISIINKGNKDKTDGILNLFSAIIVKDYEFFRDNFLKHFYKLKITKNSEDIIKLIEISSKKSLDDAFDMIFGSETGFTEEKDKIKTFIKEYSSGSCLLSGYRGVGKSTLIKSIIEILNKNADNNIEYIPIFINIPEQKKDESGTTKSFIKKDLMNKIIQQTYLELKDKGFSSKQLENLQEQYIRTFKQVEEISGYVKLTKRFGLIRTVIEVLKFSIPILSSVFIGYLVNYFSKEIGNIATKFNISQDFTKSILSGFDIGYLQLLIAGILILLNYLIFRTIFNVNYNAKLERILYNEDIAEDNFTKNLNNLGQEVGIFSKILVIFKDLIYIIYRFFPLLIEIASFPFRKIDKKFIIIIDELDKLLDFDKINKNEDKEKVSSMKDIFEILGKLKTLFFEAENILFFVVSNKEAYDYYLSNKFQEDDVISNIFNKIIYLPMNDMNQFNLNFKVDIKPKLDNALKEKIKKYLYFKSHGNWRKSNFILGNAIENTYKVGNQEIVRVNLGDYSSFINEYKFYEFFDNLYQVFEKGSLANLNNKIFEDFLFSMSHKKSGYIRDLLKVKLNQINKDIDKVNEETFYTSYLSNLQNVIKELYSNNANSVLNINDYKRINDEEEFFGYYFSSILKISNNYAYRDYILNYLLNIFENINNFKKINLIQIFKNLKIDENDLDYPVFIDLIILWTPLMLIYFNNIEINE